MYVRVGNKMDILTDAPGNAVGRPRLKHPVSGSNQRRRREKITSFSIHGEREREVTPSLSLSLTARHSHTPQKIGRFLTSFFLLLLYLFFVCGNGCCSC